MQGVNDLYTDPQIHSGDGAGFGKGNLGETGMKKFVSTHRCNHICKFLRLPLINAKDNDSGTRAPRMFMDSAKVNMYLPYHGYAHRDSNAASTSGSMTSADTFYKLPAHIQKQSDARRSQQGTTGAMNSIHEVSHGGRGNLKQPLLGKQHKGASKDSKEGTCCTSCVVM